MNKKDKTPTSVWDDAPQTEVTAVEPAPAAKLTKPAKEEVKPTVDFGFDLDGLMTDFPNATELQKFVYDQTGLVLNLKGRANKLKYQVAMDCLNGLTPPVEFIGSENPYVDRNELVPHDSAKILPSRDPSILAAGPEINVFDTNLFPHPDPELKAQGMNCQVRFCKYASGMITYEILGPVFQKAVGEKINKYGKMIPERYAYVDPRSGEQVIVRNDGSLTPLGTKIRGFMRKQRMNKSNMWEVWVDRDIVVRDEFVSDNPWQTN